MTKSLGGSKRSCCPGWICSPESGYTLIEVILAVAIAGIAILIVLSAVSSNLLGIQVLKTVDDRMVLAQRVIEEVESETAENGFIPLRFASMTEPGVFADATEYSYQVWADDVEIGGETVEDLKRVTVAVYKTADGISRSISLSTVLRISPP